MIFKQVDEILSGRKTVTRRIYKPGETAFAADFEFNRVQCVTTNKGRVKWEVGKTYAVVPKRGMPTVMYKPDQLMEGGYSVWPSSKWVSYGDGVTFEDITPDVLRNWNYKPLRIRILSLRREPLQSISVEDAIAEGYPYEYPATGPVNHPHQASPTLWYQDLWTSINTRKGTRWQDAPDVWRIEFQVVRA